MPLGKWFSFVRSVPASCSVIHHTVKGWLSGDTAAQPPLLRLSYKATWIHIDEGKGNSYFSHTHTKHSASVKRATITSISLCRAYWLANFSKGLPWKMDGCVVLLSRSWHCYTRCIKWAKRQWRITHAQTVSNCNLAPQRKIYQEKNDAEHWSCAVPPAWPFFVTGYDNIM